MKQYDFGRMKHNFETALVEHCGEEFVIADKLKKEIRDLKFDEQGPACSDSRLMRLVYDCFTDVNGGKNDNNIYAILHKVCYFVVEFCEKHDLKIRAWDDKTPVKTFEEIYPELSK